MPPISNVFNSFVRMRFLPCAMNDTQGDAKAASERQQQDERPQYSIEFVFRDTIDNVLQHLNAYELCQVAQVCKFFNEAAEREFSKRKPQLVLLPDTFDSILTSGNDFHISKMINCRPDLVVMFCGPRPHLRSVLNLEFTILSEYKKRLPDRVIILGVDISVLNGQQIRSSPTDFGKTMPNGLQALLLSRYRQLKFKIASCESHERESTRLANRMMEQLVLEDPDEEATLLCFGRQQFSTCEKVLRLMRQRFTPNNFKLWGFSTGDVVKIIDIPKNDFPAYQGMESFIGVRITGPNLKSYSYVMDLRDKKPQSQLKLAEFASKVEARGHTIGLISGPRHAPFDLLRMIDRERPDAVEYQNFKDIVGMVMTAFPRIDFSAVFNESQSKSFGMDSTRDANDQPLVHTNAATLIILTFD